LQPLEKLDKLNIESPHLLLSGQRWDSIKEFDRQLSLFGFSDKNITKIKANWTGTKKESCIFVPKLFYLSPSAYFSQLSISGLQFIKKAYSKIITPKHPKGLKLYLSREKAKNRKVTNNQEVENFLKKYGFIIVDGSESLEKDIELFRNAEIIIAPHGSLIRNMIHSNQSLKVIEFCPQGRKDFNFKHLGELMGIDYTWISVPCDDQFNIKININKLKELLNETS
jgi:capsular polysaccharide biosynthesis protein